MVLLAAMLRGWYHLIKEDDAMGNDWVRKLAAIAFAVIVMVYGSVLLQQCSADHPIVLDRTTGNTVSVW